MIKHYAGLARVSSREQEREGFSLEVQEEALHRFAEQQDGVIDQLFRIAETASKAEERKTFQRLVEYAKAHAHELDALLFFKVDRAARNLFDYVELERLEQDYGVPSIYVSQPTENTPAGRMMRRTLANMAAFYTEQQSLDVKDGIARRVHNGLFPNRPPYGYRAQRVEGRSIVEVDPIASRKVQRLFDLYAYGNHTLDTLIEQLAREGITYTDATYRFPRSKLHAILRDRAYIGEVH
ncbi:MAG: recombinase family protein, partial [bacterium]